MLNSASDRIHPSLEWYSPTEGGRGTQRSPDPPPTHTHRCYGGEDTCWGLESPNTWVVEKPGRPFREHCQLLRILLARIPELFIVAKKSWMEPEQQWAMKKQESL